MLNIKGKVAPFGATHISQHGTFIKDIGETSPYNPNRPELGNEETEVYWEWCDRHRVWGVRFGRHLSKISLSESN